MRVDNLDLFPLERILTNAQDYYMDVSGAVFSLKKGRQLRRMKGSMTPGGRAITLSLSSGRTLTKNLAGLFADAKVHPSFYMETGVVKVTDRSALAKAVAKKVAAVNNNVPVIDTAIDRRTQTTAGVWPFDVKDNPIAGAASKITSPIAAAAAASSVPAAAVPAAAATQVPVPSRGFVIAEVTPTDGAMKIISTVFRPEDEQLLQLSMESLAKENLGATFLKLEIKQTVFATRLIWK